MTLERILNQAATSASTPSGIIRGFFRRMLTRSMQGAFEDVMEDLQGESVGLERSGVGAVDQMTEAVDAQTTGDLTAMLGAFGNFSTETVDAGQEFVRSILGLAAAAGATEEQLGAIDFSSIMRDGFRSLGGGAFEIDLSKLQNVPDAMAAALTPIADQLNSDTLLGMIRERDAGAQEQAPPPPEPSMLERFAQRFDGTFRDIAQTLTGQRAATPVEVSVVVETDRGTEVVDREFDAQGNIVPMTRDVEEVGGGLDAMLNALGDVGDAGETQAAASDSLEDVINAAAGVTEQNTNAAEGLQRGLGSLAQTLLRLATPIVRGAAQVGNRIIPQGLQMPLRRTGARIGARISSAFGGSAAAGARAGAGLAAAAPVIAGAAIAVGLFVKAVKASIKVLEKWREEGLREARRLSEFAGPLAADQAIADVHKTLRDIRTAQEAGGALGDLIEAQDDYEEATRELDRDLLILTSEIAALYVNLKTLLVNSFVKPVMDLKNAIGAFVKGEGEPVAEGQAVNEANADAMDVIQHVAGGRFFQAGQAIMDFAAFGKDIRDDFRRQGDAADNEKQKAKNKVAQQAPKPAGPPGGP